MAARQQFASDRIWVDAEMGCWLWLGCIDAAGYARIGHAYGHRSMYETHKGPIPAGLHIDHLCRMRACVNPDHLEAVTQAENNRRALQAPRRHRCSRGHDLNDPKNVYRRKNGGRLCKTCALWRANRTRSAA